MNADMIERLLMDRALGSLSPDCEMLLSDYLRSRPDLQAQQAAIEQTVSLARDAMIEPMPGALPSLRTDQLQHAARKTFYLRTAWRITAVAASVLLGFTLHAALFRPAPPDRGRPAPAFVEAPMPTHADHETDQGPTFWSVRRLHDRAAASVRPERSGRLIWESPATAPRVGDQT